MREKSEDIGPLLKVSILCASALWVLPTRKTRNPDFSQMITVVEKWFQKANQTVAVRVRLRQVRFYVKEWITFNFAKRFRLTALRRNKQVIK